MDELLVKSADESNIISRIEKLEQKINDILAQDTSVSSLDVLSNDMGDIRSGRFLCLSSGVEPTDPDACGVYIAADGEEFDGETYHLGGVNNGGLQFGLNATTGKAVFAGGNAIIDIDGISATDLLKWLVKQTATNSTYTRIGKLGMALQDGGTIPVWELSYESPAGTELVTNGGAEDGDFTGWTKTTETNCTWSIYSNPVGYVPSRTGDHCFLVERPTMSDDSYGVLTSDRFAVTATSNYLCSGYIFDYCSNAPDVIKIEIKWYDHASAGSLLRTDIITSSRVNGVWVGNSLVFKAPTGALSAAIVITFTETDLFSSYFMFDDISVSAVTVNQKLQLTDDGLDCTNGIYPYKALVRWQMDAFSSLRSGDTWPYTSAATYGPYGFYAYGSSSATANNGDEFTFDVLLEKGTYQMRIHYYRSTSSGKLDFYDNGSTFATGIDLYTVGSEYVVNNCALSYSGLHHITAKVNGKNASSTDYTIIISDIEFMRTGD